MNQILTSTTALDHDLSNRFIELDPAGYFIIYVDIQNELICAKHFTNFIDDRGLACDPETGKPISCSGKVEISVKLFEQTNPCPVTRLDHAAYLGREFQRAEVALCSGQAYIQD
jgi:dihydropteroate synthase